ncbi:MAG TPA: hypothetical protein V6D35_18395 [Candidatus Sericytochromatia bacterium]
MFINLTRMRSLSQTFFARTRRSDRVSNYQDQLKRDRTVWMIA